MTPFLKTLRHLCSSRAGRRFQNVHLIDPWTRKPWMKTVKLLLGILLIAVGIFLLAVPGPGLVVVLVGLGVLASASRTVACLLDRSEVLARNWWHKTMILWREAPWYGRIAFAALLAGLVAAAGFGVLVFFFRFQFIR
jgi:thiol:disulfide interchange protein